MYAVVVSGGKQYRVSEGDTVVVDRLNAEVGSTIELGPVLAVEGAVGTPFVDGATVRAEVVSHGLGRKRTTFKYKRRKRYRRHTSSRPHQTTLRIQQIQA